MTLRAFRGTPPPGIATSQSTSGVITAVSANSSLIRPDLSLAGRVFVDGPTGNVAIGDISSYNTTVAPVAKLEVDGDALVRGHLTFDDSNGDSSLVVVPSNPAALTLKDAASTPVVYAVVNSDTGRLETHAPLHVLDTRVEARDDHPTGLQITAEAGNPMLTFDTTNGAENVVSSYRITVEDASDSCGTSTDATCAFNASVVAAGGLTVTKKSFLTGARRGERRRNREARFSSRRKVPGWCSLVFFFRRARRLRSFSLRVSAGRGRAKI